LALASRCLIACSPLSKAGGFSSSESSMDTSESKLESEGVWDPEDHLSSSANRHQKNSDSDSLKKALGHDEITNEVAKHAPPASRAARASVSESGGGATSSAALLLELESTWRRPEALASSSRPGSLRLGCSACHSSAVM
jgi:hypothetical protein